MSEELSANSLPSPEEVVKRNEDMMTKIASDAQDLKDIQFLTSSKVTDQLKVFLVAQARNKLIKVVKLTKFLDRVEAQFENKVDDAMMTDSLTLKQYSDIISVITSLIADANATVSSVLKDDSLMTILNTTVYSTDSSTSVTAVTSQLGDAQSRERVRSILREVLHSTANLVQEDKDIVEIDSSEGEEVNG